ncbi:fibronectin type III domain-containing protein [Trueperella pyogenes]|uniref:fibronectin type III domain-containing protein n=1 Tax=Trueperella pyogenes TaxID=1661 RepID=UPI00345D386E
MAPTYAADTPDPSRISVNEATRSVGGKPSAPTNVRAGILSSTTVLVEFSDTVTPAASPVSQYTVTLTPTAGSTGKREEKKLSKADELKKKSVVFNNPTPNAEYKVAVVATTKDGDSSPVSPIYEKVRLTGSPADPKIEVSTSTGLKLDELDPAKDIGNLPVAPRNATLTRVGEGKNVRVTWEVPQDDTRITGYRVELYKDGESNPVTFCQVGKNNKYVELPISDDGVYTASVRSEIRRNDDLSATPLRSMPAKTDQLTISAKDSNKPKAVPETPKKPNLRLALKDAKALEAFLFPPESPSGKITNYDIELRGSDGSVKALQADMKSDLPEVMKISDVKLGVTYIIRVRAQNAQGWSPWSEESNKVTIPANQDEFAMTPPKEVFVLIDTETSTAKIRWIKSDYEPKDVRWHVRIECVQDCPAGSEPITGIQPIGVTGIDFANLKPGVYQASLTLVNGQKTSKPVKSDKFAVGVPAVVPNPKITVTPTSQTLTRLSITSSPLTAPDI